MTSLDSRAREKRAWENTVVDPAQRNGSTPSTDPSAGGPRGGPVEVPERVSPMANGSRTHQYDRWTRRDLTDADFVYWWADGVWPVEQNPEDSIRPGLLVIIGVRSDGSKELLALTEGHRESAESWADLLHDLEDRGLAAPVLAIGDASLGIWDGLADLYDGAVGEQECWVHRTANVLNLLPKRLHRETRAGIQRIFNADSRAQAFRASADLMARLKDHPGAAAEISDHLDRLMTFYDFPKEHWKHLRSTHPITSTFDSIRPQFTRADQEPRARDYLVSAYALIEDAQKKWRRINGAALTSKVRDGAVFVNGKLRKGNRNDPPVLSETSALDAPSRTEVPNGSATAQGLTEPAANAAGVRAGERPTQLVTRLRRSITSNPRVVHPALIAVAAFTAVWSLPRLDPNELGVLGLASNLSFITYLAMALLLVGFAYAVVHRPTHRLLGAYVAVTTVVMHSLGPFVYEYPRFSWAWKHVGVVDFIQRTGAVNPTIESLQVYQNYPGFFGLGALFSETAGVVSPLSYIAWAPVLFNLLYVATLYVVLRTFTLDERVIWTGLMVFVLGNWVGQDYFAPQAVAFLFYLAVIAILLHWFPTGRKDHDHLADDLEPSIAAGIVFVLLAAMVVTHQLTPVMMMSAAAGLTFFRMTKLRWPFSVTMILVLTWAVGFARPFFDEYLPKIIADLSKITSRIESGLIDYGQVDTSQRFVSLGSRGLTLLVLALAGLGFLRAYRDGIRWKPALVLAGTPLILIAASSYGDEILFRAFLFVLPMAAYFAGALWFSRQPAGRERLTIVTLAIALIVMAFLSIVARHGNDVRTVFSEDEVAAAATMYEDAPDGSGVIQLSVAYPTKFMNYERLTELSVSTFSQDAKARFLSDPDSVFAGWLGEGGFSAGYVLLTRSQEAEIIRNGFLPADAATDITRDLRQSSDFEILYDSTDAMLFKLRDPA